MDRLLDELVVPFAFGGSWGPMDRSLPQVVECDAPACTLVRFESLWEAIWDNASAPAPAKDRPETTIPKPVVDEANTLYNIVGKALRSVGGREGEELEGTMVDSVRRLCWFCYSQARQDALVTAR